MRRATALLTLALAGGLLMPLPSRAADEPVATAPIPPPPAAATPASKERPHAGAVSEKPVHQASGESRKRRSHAKAGRRKPSARAVSEARNRRAGAAGEGKITRAAQPERHHILASREPPQRQPVQRLRRYRREEYVVEPATPPFPPPWYDRGPPFAYLPYPRGPMPPWEF